MAGVTYQFGYQPPFSVPGGALDQNFKDVQSYTAPGTGAASTTIANKLSQIISVLDFTGVDNSGLTDSTVGLQNAFNASTELYFPQGNYLYSTLTVPKTLSIYSPGGEQSANLIQISATLDGIVVNTTSPCIIDGLNFSASVTKTAGAFVNFASAAGYCQLRNFTMNAPYVGVRKSGAGSTGLRIMNGRILSVASGGTGVYISDNNNSVDMILAYLWITSTAAQASVYITNAGDIELNHVSCNVGVDGIAIVPGNGQSIQSCTLLDCLVDQCTGWGIRAQPTGTGHIDLLKMTDQWSATNTTGGILLDGTIKQTEIVSATVANNNSHGLLINSASVSKTTVLGGSFSANTGSGILINSNVNSISVIGAKCGPSGQFGGNAVAGIAFGTGCDNFLLDSCDVRGNTSTAIGTSTYPGTPGSTYWIKNCNGFVSRNAGVATLSSAATTTAVTHGLGGTPRAQDILLTQNSSLGTAAQMWVSAVAATTFTITTNVNPGAGVTVAWQASVYGG